MQKPKLFSKDLIELDVQCDSKDEVLREIADIACNSSILENYTQNQIFKKLKKREQISSTGFESRIAIPHCPVEEISDFVVGALRTSQGVDFDSYDGEPTQIFIFIILPAEKRDEHIRLLSKLANALKSEKNVDNLLESYDELDFREKILKYISTDTEKERSEEYNLFNILVQNEEIFDTVLNYVAEIEDCNIAIFDTNNASKYLYKQPLFSGFWTEEKQQYSRMIKAAVNESFANDLIRKLNMLIDDHEKQDIAFWVQEIFYFNGSVNL